MLVIKSQTKDYGVAFPTSLSEITPDILKSITDHVILPKHYCIVAMCFKTTLFEFVAKLSKSKGIDIPVTNLLAKINSGEDSDSNYEIGSKLIVNRSSIERGFHLSIPIAIGSNAAYEYIDADNTLRKNIMDGSYLKDRGIAKGNDSIYLMEFKIVPIVDIAAVLPINFKGQDPFKVLI